MRVEQTGAAVGRAGEMDLDDAVGGHRVEVGLGVESEVPRADVDVVHVEEQRAVGLFGKTGDELRFGHS